VSCKNIKTRNWVCYVCINLYLPYSAVNEDMCLWGYEQYGDQSHRICLVCLQVIPQELLNSSGLNTECALVPKTDGTKILVKVYLPADSDALKHRKYTIISYIQTMMNTTSLTSTTTASNTIIFIYMNIYFGVWHEDKFGTPQTLT
jgi:hypothetical protein